MDVNRSEPVVPVAGRDPHRGQKNRQHDDGHEEDARDGQPHEEPWPDEDAVDIESALSRAMTPDVQAALEALASRIEPMRQDLERASLREQEQRRQLEQHPYLPVLNRSGLEHEVSRITSRLARGGGASGTGPAFLCISVRTAPDVRVHHGRAAYDQVMTGACNILKETLSDNDFIGCLGGDDLGVVAIESAMPDALVERVRQAFAGARVDVGSMQLRLTIDVGACSLLDHSSFAAALAAADAQLIRQAAA